MKPASSGVSNVYDTPVIVKDWRQKEIHIYLIWDAHFGSAHCDYALLREARDQIAADPLGVFILGGDNMEAIASADWRSFAGKHDNYRRDMKVSELRHAQQTMRDEFVKLWRPVKDKCLVVLEGNHEATWGRLVDFELAREIATLLNAPYGGYECGLVVRFHNRTNDDRAYSYIGAISHGWGGGMYPGGKLNRQMIWADHFVNARYTVRGHTHDLENAYHQMAEICPNKRGFWNVQVYDRMDIIAGTFLNGAHYQKQSGLRPKVLGWQVIRAKLVDMDCRTTHYKHPKYFIRQQVIKGPY